jgi:hypothetical protein
MEHSDYIEIDAMAAPHPVDLRVHTKYFALKYCRLPTELNNLAQLDEATQLTAMKQNGLWLHYLSDPSPALQLAAVEQNGWAIALITDPSVEVRKIALEGAEPRQGLTNDERLNFASEDSLMELVASGCEILKYLQAPSEPVQLAAVSYDIELVGQLAYPSESTQLYVIERDTCLLERIEVPKPSVLLRAIELNPLLLFVGRHSNKITPEMLESIKPGLALEVDTIRAFSADVDARVAMYLAARQAPSMALDLPLDLDFSDTAAVTSLGK